MNQTTQTALLNKLLSLADDEIILAHRNSEWIGHAPILEEDIALANISQDELGHATVWYKLYCDLTGDDPDQLVFFRDAEQFRNVPFVELPKGDWAVTMLRQFLFDAYEVASLNRLRFSAYQPLAEATAKIRNEEIYHFRHTSTWVLRLGLGTEESHRRMQDALDMLWPYALQLFVPLPGEDVLVKEDVGVETAVLLHDWREIVIPHLTKSGLTVPDNNTPHNSNRTNHTEHLTALLKELQLVARLDKDAKW